MASAVLELGYFVALTYAYARAPAHAVYPVARGLAPALLLVAVALTGDGVSAPAAAGVGVICTGVLLTAWGEVIRRAVLAAVPVAACIAGYTSVDGRGVHHADPAVYLWLVMAPVALGLLASRRWGDLRAQLTWPTLVVGIGLFGAYGLTLLALSLVPLAQVPVVAALRESSILFVLALSWLGLGRTRPSAATALGAALVFGGVVTLALT
jgi:drug/metabolite transporter (DMT)-like permease